ncbi:hypothetical protein [Streptomyces griseocarneus]|uniref:hypothetical protein n=1 Tax=Streptomyces griseocarneus TaxID=51201 RepID=UPI00167F150C|nr:hypothetical protein [Streptomyces griseocarneus]MBZ6472218.1 hypothetical protein [Streptomyces griseocarneus]GHG73191.1 hypothetical protein GCM10018779_49190 [Streptomyces griseocarneus]
MEQRESTGGRSLLAAIAALAGVVTATGAVVLHERTGPSGVLTALSVVLFAVTGALWQLQRRRAATARS